MSVQELYTKAFHLQNEYFKKAVVGCVDSIIGGRVIGSGMESKSDNQFAQPRGVAYDSLTHEMFVVDCNNHRVQVFDIR